MEFRDFYLFLFLLINYTKVIGLKYRIAALKLKTRAISFTCLPWTRIYTEMMPIFPKSNELSGKFYSFFSKFFAKFLIAIFVIIF